MTDEDSRALLARAVDARDQLERHLLVAAALRAALTAEPIVVGGTAEEFWTRDEYHPTDLDLCAPLSRGDERRMRALGFRRDGRHWVIEGIPIAVEFPDSSIDGALERTHLVGLDPGAARVIGLDDLYLDRLRQATMAEHVEGVEFHSALAIVAARYEELDRRYLAQRFRAIASAGEHETAAAMRRVHRRVQTRVRRRLGGG